MRTKLTDSFIRSRVPRDKQYAIGDTACVGLCLRITPKGAKSFAFAYRHKATRKVVWLTIGRYPDVTLSEARERVDDARKVAAGGGTPVLAAKAGNATPSRPCLKNSCPQCAPKADEATDANDPTGQRKLELT